MDNSKTEVLLKLYARLKQSPCSIEVLKKWKGQQNYNFSDRTLYRYINELSDSLHLKGERIEVISGPNNKKTWKLVYDDSASDFSLFDINTFYLVKHFIPKGIHVHRRPSFDKLEALLYERQSKSKFEYIAETNTLLLGNSFFGEPDYNPMQQQLLEKIILLLQKKKKIRITTGKFKDHPHFENINKGDILCLLYLKKHKHIIHLCAYNETSKKVCIFPFFNLNHFKSTAQMFSPNAYTEIANDYFNNTFGISKNLDNNIYKIEIACTNDVGNFLKRFYWHNSQKFETLENGELILQFKCGINNELVGWICQLHENLKVLSPMILQNLVVSKLKSTLNQYK